MSHSNVATTTSTRPPGFAFWNILALGVAVVAAGGSVYLSVGLGLKACPLCFYQRSFAIGAVLVLAMMLWLDGLRSSRAVLVTLPLAASGLGVAAFHVYLVQTGKLECPPALFGWGDGPQQSLTVFSALMLVCLGGAISARTVEGGRALVAMVAALLLAAGATWACIASAPPLPPTPKQQFDAVKQPFDMCRPPFPGV
jgi:disulfide bond formation protein DsbB